MQNLPVFAIASTRLKQAAFLVRKTLGLEGLFKGYLGMWFSSLMFIF